MAKILPRYVFFNDNLQAGLIRTRCTTEHKALVDDGKDTKSLQKKTSKTNTKSDSRHAEENKDEA